MAQRACMATLAVVTLLLTTQWSLAERRSKGQVTATWQRQALGKALTRLAASQEIPLWLDRRVDPQQTIDSQFTDFSVEKVLDELAKKKGLSWVWLGELVYIGPVGAAGELPPLIQQAHNSIGEIPAGEQQRWLQAGPRRWPRLSQPRALVRDLAGELGVELVGDEQITHDLWPARELPPMATIDRLVLILAGFDLTCRLDVTGKTCQIVPIQRPLEIERHFRLPTKHASMIRQIQQRFPSVRVRIDGKSLAVTGQWSDQEKIAEILADTPHRPPARTAQRKTRQSLSLTVKDQPVRVVIDHLARQLRLEVDWSKSLLTLNPTISERRVSCEVEGADLDELLGQILSPAGLSFEREGQRIKIDAD